MIEKIKIVMSWVWAAIAPTAITMLTEAGKVVWTTAEQAVKEAEQMFSGPGMGSLKFEYVLKKVYEVIETQGVKIGKALVETIIQLAVIKLQGEIAK